MPRRRTSRTAGMTILSNAPTARYAAEMQTFGHFTGAWRTHVSYLGPDCSPVRQVIGDWEFSYALDGRAVVDTWRVPAQDIACSDAEREVGLCVRIWDPRLQLWRFTFHSTATTTVIHMYARRSRSTAVPGRPSRPWKQHARAEARAGQSCDRTPASSWRPITMRCTWLVPS